MTEREKMLRGELYDSSDNELEQLRLHARKLARRYNLADEDQQEVQAQILRELLPATEELPYLQAPVYFDYGCHTYFGKYSSANFNFTCLDVGVQLKLFCPTNSITSVHLCPARNTGTNFMSTCLLFIIQRKILRKQRTRTN